MKFVKLIYITLFVFMLGWTTKLPEGFVFLTDVDPTIIESVRYYTDQNFYGRRVPGYMTSRIICTKAAAERLKLVNETFKKQGYILVVYDAYRPQSSVNAFIRWSQDAHDQIAKAYYYPAVRKEDLFKLNYLAKRSGHTRGSTFDLTLIPLGQSVKPIVYSQRRLKNGEIIPFLDDNTVDMGSSFDLFHSVSHHDTSLITDEQNKMRQWLRQTMKQYGFQEHPTEWWHYTLIDEPYPDTYFDFVMK